MEYSQSLKKKGWFSNRYQTAAAHLKAKEEKIKKANEQTATHNLRLAKRKERTPQQQINLLDGRLGKDVGARKERERLGKQIEGLAEQAKTPEKSVGAKTKRNQRKRRGKSTQESGRR